MQQPELHLKVAGSSFIKSGHKSSQNNNHGQTRVCLWLLAEGALVIMCSAAGSEGSPAAVRDQAGGGRLWTEAGV